DSLRASGHPNRSRDILIKIVVIDVDQQLAIGPRSAAERGEGKRIEHHLRPQRARAWGAHDPRLCAAVSEKLLHRVAQFAVRGESAEQTLEIAEAEDLLSAIVDSASCVSDERCNRRRHAGYGVHAARKFLDINTGITDRHWHRSAPYFFIMKSA